MFSTTQEHRPLYVGVPRPDKIYLYHSESPEGIGHYDAIINIKGCLGVAYFCQRCFVGYNSKNKHNCSAVCEVCRAERCSNQARQPVLCHSCNMLCKNMTCFNEHRRKLKDVKGKLYQSQCEQIVMCPKCLCIIRRNKGGLEKHICGMITCKNCKMNYIGENDHGCTMRAKEIKEEDLRMIFFDVETDQTNNKHVPVLIVSQSVCRFCEHENLHHNAKCSECGSRCQKCSKRVKGKLSMQ